MECERIRRKLSPFLDGELTDEESHFVAAHLENCSSCAQECEELERLGELLSNLEPAAAPAYLYRRVEEKAGRPVSESLWPRLVRRFVYAPVAAALLVGVLIGTHLGQNISEKLTTGDEDAPVTTDLGDYPPVSLADVYLGGWEE
jgi:anti-sigma factor RsiW